MTDLPDISDELKIIRCYTAAEEELRRFGGERDDAVDAIREKYKKAGVTREDCDHPHITFRSGDSVNVCFYCDECVD